MIWLFDRDGEKISYEVCRDEGGDGFLLVRTSANGDKRVDRIAHPTELIERCSEEMRELQDQGWKIG